MKKSEYITRLNCRSYCRYDNSRSDESHHLKKLQIDHMMGGKKGEGCSTPAAHSKAQHRAQHSTENSTAALPGNWLLPFFYHIFHFFAKKSKIPFEFDGDLFRPTRTLLSPVLCPSLPFPLSPAFCCGYVYFNMGGPREEGGLCQVRVHFRVDHPRPFLI